MQLLPNQVLGQAISNVLRPRSVRVMDEWTAYPVLVALGNGLALALRSQDADDRAPLEAATYVPAEWVPCDMNLDSVRGHPIARVLTSDLWPAIGLELRSGQVIGWGVDLVLKEVYPTVLTLDEVIGDVKSFW